MHICVFAARIATWAAFATSAIIIPVLDTGHRYQPISHCSRAEILSPAAGARERACIYTLDIELMLEYIQ